MERLRSLWLRPPEEESVGSQESDREPAVLNPAEEAGNVTQDRTEVPPKRERKEDQEGPVPTVRPWEPPKSPFGLLQETYYTSPWRLLVVSILLNVTSGRHQVRPVVGDLFDRYPSPEAMAQADEEELAGMIRRLGLYRKRAKALVDFSRTYLDSPPWRTPAELKYFGKYADDSYRLFCLGEWREVRPRDKKLKQYRDWLYAHYGAEKSESELEEEHEWAEQEVRRKQRMREAREQKKEERKRARAADLDLPRVGSGL